MKKDLFFLSMLAFIGLSVFALFGCKKIPFDFRNKYCGDYNFVYSYSLWQYGIGVYDADTIYYSGKVYYDKKGNIKINYDANSTLELGIEKNGNLRLDCGALIGKFENKSKLELNYSTNTCGNGALGASSSFSIIGTKK